MKLDLHRYTHLEADLRAHLQSLTFNRDETTDIPVTYQSFSQQYTYNHTTLIDSFTTGNPADHIFWDTFRLLRDQTEVLVDIPLGDVVLRTIRYPEGCKNFGRHIDPNFLTINLGNIDRGYNFKSSGAMHFGMQSKSYDYTPTAHTFNPGNNRFTFLIFINLHWSKELLDGQSVATYIQGLR